jgi:hypothetical protein
MHNKTAQNADSSPTNCFIYRRISTLLTVTFIGSSYEGFAYIIMQIWNVQKSHHTRKRGKHDDEAAAAASTIVHREI